MEAEGTNSSQEQEYVNPFARNLEKLLKQREDLLNRMPEEEGEEISDPITETKPKMGRPRKYDENNPRPPQRRRSRAKVIVNTDSILADIKKLKESNPLKKEKEIHSMFLESKRDWIIASIFDTAANADSETVRYNARARLKDELDGRVATQDKKDPDEDNAIGSILIPEEM